MGEALVSGARVGSYEVIDRLGQGGMGEVYRARDTRLGRTVALKVLRSGADPELLHRLDREARAASALNHPNIVHIYDVGLAASETGAHFVVMEYVEGETLRRRLARGALAIPDLLELGAQLTDGLAKAHRAGILHRDLKPENLMVTPDGVLKILDFGLAKVLAAPLGDVSAGETVSRHETQAGVLLGTLEYMSPEQASGRPTDHRTDQFSVGLILCEMATGRPLFRRDTPAQVLAAVIERDPEPLRQLRPDAPQALEAVVSRCLQKDPERRFAKTDALASELSALAGRSRSGSLLDIAISAEVLPAVTPPPLPPAPVLVYHVQTDDRVQSYDEAKLVKLIRRGKLSGAELAREDDKEEWRPLFESRVFRREIPTVAGDPRDAARMRQLRGVGAQLTGLLTTGAIMFAITHQFPFWLGIWGAVVGIQALKAAPAAWAIFQRRRAERDAVAGNPRLPPAGTPRQIPAPPVDVGVSSAVAQEGARVRVLIEKRGGNDTARLLAEVDRILKVDADLASRLADLEEQTSERERSALATAVSDAQARLDRADSAQDRRLFELQLKVVRGREEGIAKAVRVLERLRVRRELAEHQLKQLRLDLSRGAASGLDVPELSSRLQFIRYEVDAQEEIDERDAGRA